LKVPSRSSPSKENFPVSDPEELDVLPGTIYLKPLHKKNLRINPKRMV